MRRKTFDIFFEPSQGLAALVKQPSLWRSGFYFTISVGLFAGVITNTWLIAQPLDVRLAIVLGTVLVMATVLILYGLLLHGIMEAFGALAGDAQGLICLLGYTTLPFLLLTPEALLVVKMGIRGLPYLGVLLLIGSIWTLCLLVLSLEAVYLVDWFRSAVAVLFSLLLLYIVLVLPLQMLYLLLMRSLGWN